MRVEKWNDLITAYEKDPKPSLKSFYTIIFLVVLLVLIPLSFNSIQKHQIIKLPEQIQPSGSSNPVNNYSSEIVPEVSLGFNFKNEDSNEDGAVNSFDYLNPPGKSQSGKECPQVLTRACGIVYNDCKSGADHTCDQSEWASRQECKNFPTPCDVPEDWTFEKPCQERDMCEPGYVCDFDGFCRKKEGEACDVDWQCASDTTCSFEACQAGVDCSTGLSCIKREAELDIR